MWFYPAQFTKEVEVGVESNDCVLTSVGCSGQFEMFQKSHRAQSSGLMPHGLCTVSSEKNTYWLLLNDPVSSHSEGYNHSNENFAFAVLTQTSASLINSHV